MSERLAGLHALQQKSQKPQLVLTTVNAITQRTMTPFRVRQLVATLSPGECIPIDTLAALLQSNGYVRVETVTDAGEFAVRGGIVDIFPSGGEQALRLDSFCPTIQTFCRFDPPNPKHPGQH